MNPPAREPIVVHCAKCQHEWALGFHPIPIDRFVTVAKRSSCPACGGRRILMGTLPKPTPVGDAMAWLGNGDTGISSLVIWHVLMGMPPDRVDVPHDPDDFGRCHRLLQVMPEWRARLGDVAVRYAEWRPFVDAWPELTALYEQELPTGRCDRLYARMRALTGAAV
jgi:hypothetical protein